MSSTFFQVSLASLPRKRSRAPGLYQASAPSASKASTMRTSTSGSCKISTEPSGFSLMNTAIGTPQARWREITQSGRCSIMPVMRFSPCGGHPAGDGDRVQRAGAQCIAAAFGDVFIHRDEPLRRIAEDDRLLRTPGMRILMLEAAARDDHAGFDQSLDHRLVGVALLAFVVDDALAGEAGGLFGESAVFVDGVRDGRIDAADFAAPRDWRSRPRSPRGRVLAPCAQSPCRCRR